MKYWNESAELYTTYQELYDKLVPMSGACDTVAGELLRAASRIYYDAYNNGFCNNTSGALNYLVHMGVPGIELPANTLDGCVNTGDYSEFNDGDAVDQALDLMVDVVVTHITNTPELQTLKNEDDLFNYQDEEARPEDDNDEYLWDEDEGAWA